MCKDPVALGSKPRSSEREKEHGVKRSQTKRYRGQTMLALWARTISL